MEDKVLQFIKEQTGKRCVRSKGNFWDMYNSKTSASWGWTAPIKFENVRIVYLSFSPHKKGDTGLVSFDFLSEEEYQKALDIIDSK